MTPWVVQPPATLFASTLAPNSTTSPGAEEILPRSTADLLASPGPEQTPDTAAP